MSANNPAIELEQLRLEVARLKAERESLLASIRKLQAQLQTAHAYVMGVVNQLQGTNR